MSSIKPGFLKSGLIYTFANVASSAVPFLLLPLLTRVLTPAEYAVIVNFSLLVTLFAAFAGLNVHGALSVIWFKQSRDEFPSYVFTALVLAIVSTAVMVILPFIVFDSTHENVWWMNHFTLGLAAFTAGCNIIFQCRVVLWQCQQKPIFSAAAQIFFSLFNVGLSLLLVLVFYMGADGRNIAIACTSFLAAIVAIVCFIGFREINTVFSFEKAKALLVFGVPLVLHIVAGVLLSATDRWVIAIKLDPASLGIYGAGAQLGMTMTLLADAFVKAYGPWIYTKLASDVLTDRHVAVGAIYVAIPGFIISSVFLGVILKIIGSVMLGPTYISSLDILFWFTLGGAFNGAYVCVSVLFFFNGKTGLLSMTTFSAAIIGAALTWYLVGVFGLIGAAAGFLVSQILLAVFVFLMAVKNFNLPWDKPLIALRYWWLAAIPKRHFSQN